MRILDLFCGAGGAAMGYHQAGFEVVGVDLNPQPNYPFDFLQADAIWWLESWDEQPAKFIESFDAVHASPPCQAKTTMSNRWRGYGGLADERVSLISRTRELLNKVGLPWVMENVTGARPEMPDAVCVTGGPLGLRTHRPRLFEASFPLAKPATKPRAVDPIGIYGPGAYGQKLWKRVDGSYQRRASSVEEARDVMEMPWADWREIAEAIPPAYTKWVGDQLMSHLKGAS
jgi:DNA (cytosine-5)-methyltransferase 1